MRLGGNTPAERIRLFRVAFPKMGWDVNLLALNAQVQDSANFLVKSKNVYALRKLLSQEAAKLKLKSSSGQFIFGNDSVDL